MERMVEQPGTHAARRDVKHLHPSVRDDIGDLVTRPRCPARRSRRWIHSCS
jgi:hypothetical protein